MITDGDYRPGSSRLAPGDVLALLTPLQDLPPGLYLYWSIAEDWVVLRWLVDDEAGEQIFVTEREATVPATLLQLFTPVGLRMPTGSQKITFH